MTTLLLSLANLALVLVLAPFIEGVIRKITARIQSRQGPPIHQPWIDLAKLLGKEDIESGVSPVMQRLTALGAFAAILAAALLVPMGSRPPLDGGGDVILLIYVLTFCGIATLLAGLAAGSTYSLLGMSREMMAMMALEPILAVTLVAASIHAGSLRLSAIFSGAIYGGTVPVSGVLFLGVAILAFQALVGRVPFDTSEAETEIMEGPLIEYSGPKLALFKYTMMAKLFVYASLLVGLFAPWGSGLVYPAALAIFLAKVAIVMLGVTLVAATNARYRIDQAIRYYGWLLGAAGIGLVLAVMGW